MGEAKTRENNFMQRTTIDQKEMKGIKGQLHNEGKNEDAVEKIFPLNSIQKAYISGRNPETFWGGRSCQMCVVTHMKEIKKETMHKALTILEQKYPILKAYVFGEEGIKICDKDFGYPIVTEEDVSVLKKRLIAFNLPLSGPLYQAYIAGKERRLVVLVDMIISDAASMYIFIDEIKKIYEQILKGNDVENFIEKPMKIQNFNFHEKKVSLEETINIASTMLPISNYIPEYSKYTTTHRDYFIDCKAWNQFKEIAAHEGIDPISALLAIYSVCLGMCSASDVITLNMTVTTRNFEKKVEHGIYDYTDVVYVSVPIHIENMLEVAINAKKAKKDALVHQLGKSTEIARRMICQDPMNGYSPYVFTCTVGLGEKLGRASFLKESSEIATSTPQVIIDEQIYEKENGILICWDSIDEAFLIPTMVEELFEHLCLVMDKACREDDFWHTKVIQIMQSPLCEQGRVLSEIAQGSKAIEYLSKEGIYIYMEHGKLKYRAPKGKMSETKIAFLKKYKDYILKYFNTLEGTDGYTKQDFQK